MELLRPFFEQLVQITTDHKDVSAIGKISQAFYTCITDDVIKFNMPMGDNIVWEHMDGVTLLTHAHSEVTASPPHDHGSEWVFYGVLDGITTMTDFYEIPDSESSIPGQGKLALKAQYTLAPGQWAFYDIEDIHSHYTTAFSKWIRIESRNIHRGDIEGKMWNWDDIIR